MATCLHPILAVSLYKNEDNKNVLQFLPSGDIWNIEQKKQVYGSEEVFLLPCGRCSACREEYAKEWAKRCSIEAKIHKYNYFITLTYDEYHISKASKLDFSQKFLKALGFELTGSPDRPRFFACMERGELTGRLHFHAILFLDKELELIEPVKKGDFYHYHSPIISKLWTFGLHDIAPFEHDCAAYVGKYATKSGKCFMSRNLAKPYYLVNREQIINDDFKIYVDYNKRNFIDVPKCFVRWFCEDDIAGILDYKLKRSQLQRLLILADIHTNKMKSESLLVSANILAYLKHTQNKAERSEL